MTSSESINIPWKVCCPSLHSLYLLPLLLPSFPPFIFRPHLRIMLSEIDLIYKVLSFPLLLEDKFLSVSLYRAAFLSICLNVYEFGLGLGGIVFYQSTRSTRRSPCGAASGRGVVGLGRMLGGEKVMAIHVRSIQ